MTQNTYLIELTPQEEKIAQLLTRDAWGYFTTLITQRELFQVKEIPMMPRRGILEIVNDAEIIQYYLDNARIYEEELALLGWSGDQAIEAAATFVEKVARITGIQVGMGQVGGIRVA